MELWIPQIQPSLEVEAYLNRRLASGVPIPITYMKRLTMSLITIVGQDFSFMIASGVTKTPRYVIVGFKPGNNPNIHVNDSLSFIEGNTSYNSATKKWSNPTSIQQIELQLNNVNYPNQPIRIKYDNTVQQIFTLKKIHESHYMFYTNSSVLNSDLKSIFVHHPPIFGK